MTSPETFLRCLIKFLTDLEFPSRISDEYIRIAYKIKKDKKYLLLMTSMMVAMTMSS